MKFRLPFFTPSYPYIQAQSVQFQVQGSMVIWVKRKQIPVDLLKNYTGAACGSQGGCPRIRLRLDCRVATDGAHGVPTKEWLPFWPASVKRRTMSQ